MIAILSDIHANLLALEAVLLDAHRFPITSFYCLGDTVGYGPDPLECHELLQKIQATSVRGNHEDMLSNQAWHGQAPPTREDEILVAGIRLAWSKLPEPQRKYLVTLPLIRRIRSMEFVHGSLFCPAEFYYMDCVEEARRSFSCQKGSICFHGHTHRPAIWQEEREAITGWVLPDEPFVLNAHSRYAINVGSVGQPRDEDPRASYVVYDPLKRCLMLRRVEYAIRKAQKRFSNAGLPELNSRRLKVGH